MKLVIAGSRAINETDAYVEIIKACRIETSPNFSELIKAEEIVSGTCRGPDIAGEDYAESYGLKIKRFPADWDTYGKKAGMIRNKKMAEYANALLLIWDGKSNGSKNMKEEMEKLGKPVYEVIVDVGESNS